jgi:glycosyltransferase involved in cell wall biosynthesis
LAGARVAVVNWRDLGHSLAGGSERYAWEYAVALRNAGAQVDFVTARERDRPRESWVDGIRTLRGGGAFTFYLFAAWYLLTRRSKLDAVIDPECGIPTFSPLFLRRRTPVVLVVHHVHLDQFATYFPRPLALFGQFLEGWVMPRVYRNVRTVAVSDSTRSEMLERLHWQGEIGILANGSVDVAQGLDPLAKDNDRIVALGRLVPHKRVDLVIRAIGRLAAERPGLRLDIVGRGPEEGRLRALVAELGLQDRVTMHGFLPEGDKVNLLRQAGLAVCASDVEGWGQVVIDAAAYGVPTVARDVPGLRDSIRDGSTGWLIPDRGDLAAVLDDLTDQVRRSLTALESADERTSTFDAAQEWAAQFSWQRMHAEGVQLLLDELTRRRHTPPSPRPVTSTATTEERHAHAS